MQRKDRVDLAGAAMLIGFSMLLGFNQVAIKVANGGFQPVFAAGLRSLGAILCLLIYMRLRRIPLDFSRGTIGAGLLIGSFFAVEFVLLFLALDLTTVVRTSILFYAMPVWLAIAAHFLLPGERMHRIKALGLLLAFAGVALALSVRNSGEQFSLAGDVMAVGASLCWAGIVLCARATAVARLRPEMQLMWQVLVSAPILLGVSVFLGPLIRDLAPIHWYSLAFQTVIVVSAGFILWFWLLGIYPASSVASFSFLTPIFGVGLGWLLLNEAVGPRIFGSAALVAVGILLINRPVPPAAPG